MPKVKQSQESLLNSWLQKCPEEEKNFRIERKQVFCVPCTKFYAVWDRNTQLLQHVKSSIHQDNVKRMEASHQRQSLITDGRCNDFNLDVCKMMIAADIPFNKLQHPAVTNFFEKWCNKKPPDQSTLRKSYIKPVYEKAIEDLRSQVGNMPIYLQVDETTDSKGRFVANIIVGPLNPDRVTTPQLLMVKELPAANNSTITQLVLDALNFLWPNLSQAEVSGRFLVFLTDMAPYMVLAGKNLKKIYPKLLHVTCVAHALNRVAETVRSSFKQVDKLLSNVKAIFKKAPTRVRKYKEMNPELSLPPEPVLTRWGTWLRAANFLASHFEEIKSVVMEFDSSEAESIKSAQRLFNKTDVVAQLTELSTNYSSIADTIEKLERRDLDLNQTLTLLNDLQTSITSSISSQKEVIGAKFENVLKKNPDLSQLKKILAIFQGEQNDIAKVYSPSELAAFKYCPLTSVEVERSFSMSKAILRDNRQSMLFENFEMYAVCHYQMSL